jgi:hypothetical protein
MKWFGYGLQAAGGVLALTGMGVFAVGKLVERAALGHHDSESGEATEEERVAHVDSFGDTHPAAIT